jgi:adenylate kinase family enzyme
MQRILVIGSGGAGKSTVAAKLGEKLGLEVNHLDKFYWRSGWVEPPREEWVQTVTELINRDSWIIDGNYGGTLELRMQRCDTIVFLDLSRVLCVWRILKRNLRYRRGGRPDMAEGCLEKLDPKFVSWIWNYSRRSRPRVVELIRTQASGKRVVWLRSKAEVEKFLSDPQGKEINTDVCPNTSGAVETDSA